VYNFYESIYNNIHMPNEYPSRGLEILGKNAEAGKKIASKNLDRADRNAFYGPRTEEDQAKTDKRNRRDQATVAGLASGVARRNEEFKKLPRWEQS
jgi:hypothetical protein